MRRRFALAAAAVAIVLAGAGLRVGAESADSLRPVSDFAGIADDGERAAALFNEAAKVLMHPRCLNCHPVGDRPFQNDAMRPHEPLVVRGEDGHGAAGMPCAACHGDANYEPAGVPGDPHWALAPASMAWVGKSAGEICRQLSDPEQTGGRDLAAILDHVANDSLVLWGWDPGAGRTPAPGTNAEFAALLRAWVDAGAGCPPA
ncbi:MAG: Isoquinoline 1-oxidoreductase subunit [Alphaproteobacteria bacterium]